MLEPVLASNAQSAVLAFLLAAPERSFSATELQTRLRLSAGASSLALGRLGKLGLVTSFRKGSQKYFLLNAKHPRLPQIRAALPKQKYEDELFVAIRKLGEIRAAFLSGIFTGQPQLPVDILLVGKVNLKKLDLFLSACQKLMGQEINYSIMSPEEFQTRRNTFDRFIKDIFDYRHLVVIDTLGHRRLPTKRSGSLAWDKKFTVSRF
jgi:hypothetical protein